MAAKTTNPAQAAPKLTLVSDDVYHFNRKPETPAERIKRLQVEARILAREQIEAFDRAIQALADQARDVANGGEAYPVGVREMASRLAEDLEGKGQTIAALLERTPLPKL